MVRGILFGSAAWGGGALVLALGLSRAAARNPLEGIAASDPLTGLLDDRAFHAEASQLLESPAGGSLPIVLFETEGVSGINSDCGRLAGDELIRAASEIVASAANGLGKAFHFGGGRFAVLVDAGATSGTFQILRLAQPSETDIGSCGHSHVVSFQAGFASSKPGEDLSAVMRRAEQRLLASKRSKAAGPDTHITRAG